MLTRFVRLYAELPRRPRTHRLRACLHLRSCTIPDGSYASRVALRAVLFGVVGLRTAMVVRGIEAQVEGRGEAERQSEGAQSV